LPIFFVFAISPAQAQEATQECSGGRILKIESQADKLKEEPQPEESVQHLHYTISNTHGVRAAWIEVWDRPHRLSRWPVPIKTQGELPCQGCNDTEETPAELHLAIYDPAIPVVCYEGCRGNPHGAYVSEITAGKKPEENAGRGAPPAYLMEDPQLIGPPLRFVEGSPTTDVIFYGRNLIPTTRVYLTDRADAWQKGDDSLSYLPGKTLDLRHIRVTIPREFLANRAYLRPRPKTRPILIPAKKATLRSKRSLW